MREINARFGVLYIEEAAERSEEGRIKLYDSRKRYLDYFSTEGLLEEDVAALVEKTASEISKLKQIDELMDYLGIDSYSVGESWLDLLEDIYGMDGYGYDEETGEWVTAPDGDEITEATVLQNEFVCSIGDELIIICE